MVRSGQGGRVPVREGLQRRGRVGVGEAEAGAEALLVGIERAVAVRPVAVGVRGRRQIARSRLALRLLSSHPVFRVSGNVSRLRYLFGSRVSSPGY